MYFRSIMLSLGVVTGKWSDRWWI